jgi:hypothetical protein
VRPAAREGFLEERPGKLFGPRSQCFHAVKARQPSRDVHGPGRPSEDVLPRISRPSAMLAGLSEAGRGSSREFRAVSLFPGTDHPCTSR